MISIEEVEIIHAILIEKFGGVKGLRDRQVLESALARPFQTFDGKDLYPHPVEKSTALFDSLIINHPFLDGNKRTAQGNQELSQKSIYYPLSFRP